LKIVKIIRRIPAEMYGYYELYLESEGETPNQIEELANEARKKEAQARYDCPHAFVKEDTGTSKAGKKWHRKVCLDSLCGAVCWKNFDGNWGTWSWPVRH